MVRQSTSLVPFILLFAISLTVCRLPANAGGIKLDQELLENGIQADRKEQYSQAIKLLDSYLRHHPGNPRATRVRADANLNAGRYRQAVKDFTTAINQNPGDSLMYALRARAYLELGCLKQSIADHGKQIECDPTNPLSWLNRAIVETAAKQYVDVLRDCTESIRLKPTYGAYCQRAIAYQKLGMEAESARDLKRARDLPGPDGTEVNK